MSEEQTEKLEIKYYDQNWQKNDTTVELTPRVMELVREMKGDIQ